MSTEQSGRVSIFGDGSLDHSNLLDVMANYVICLLPEW